MVEPHLLLPSVYVFLLLVVNVRSRNDQRSVACRCSFPALCSETLSVAQYIRLADNACWLWLAAFNMLEFYGDFWRQINLALIFLNVCASMSVFSLSHKGFHCCRSFLTHPCTCTYGWSPLRRFGNLLKPLVAIHQSSNPFHVNIKGLVSHHDLETCSNNAPASCISPVF